MDLSDGENKTIISASITKNEYIDFYSDTDFTWVSSSECSSDTCEGSIDISVWHIDYRTNPAFDDVELTYTIPSSPQFKVVQLLKYDEGVISWSTTIYDEGIVVLDKTATTIINSKFEPRIDSFEMNYTDQDGSEIVISPRWASIPTFL